MDEDEKNCLLMGMIQGVTGWGTEHVCTNWEELQEWVGERQRLDREG